MFMRMSAVVAGALLLGGCQQAGGDRPFSLAGPTTLPSFQKVAEVPFSGTVDGVASFDATNPLGCSALPFTVVTDAKGTASHLGLTTFHGEHCTVLGPSGGQIVDGILVLTAADGDQLFGTYTGSFGPLPDIGQPNNIVSTVVFSGGTGRFTDAAGNAEIKAQVLWEGPGDPSSPGHFEWKGTLRY